MKITLLLGVLLFSVVALPNFGSECQVYDARSAPGYETLIDQNFWDLDICGGVSSENSFAPGAAGKTHKRCCISGGRIELGFDGNDKVLAPGVNEPFHTNNRSEASAIFVTAAALALASRALKSR